MLEKYQKIGIVLLLVVISGSIGWFWEFALQEFEGGFQHLYLNGGNILPWMNIYAYGALLILAICYRFRKSPWKVFLSGAIVTGTLELISGWLVYTIGNGTRYWDYNVKWYGWGTLGGFICPASVIAFGLGAVLITYCLMPWLIKIATRMSRKAFLTLSITLFSVIMVDDITNLTLKTIGLPYAQDLYKSLGWIFL
jgi:uncharacterized membrane protein